MKIRIKDKVQEMVLGRNTYFGRAFDSVFLFMIIASIVVVMMDSVPSLHAVHKHTFHKIEWGFTILFTLEYATRVSLSKKPVKFVLSFLGIVDLLAIIPTYFTLFMPGTQPLLALRALRLLRIFRIFRLSHFIADIRFLSGALISSFRKISIFLMFALVIVIVMASIMYLVEKPEDGFTSIPKCIYWAITTITTVGYGDIVPVTTAGRFVANILMLIGFAIIAVPTGIITTEMAIAIKKRETKHDICKSCKKGGHDIDAAFCKHCGAKFETE
jgi:voltage-gated potassium channel